MISSALMIGEYKRLVIDYQPYRERQVEALVADERDEPEADSTLAPTPDIDPFVGVAGA